MIRLYRSRDFSALRRCFIALQDHERSIIPTQPAGEDIADNYLTWMFDRVARCEGIIGVVDAGQVEAFVTLLRSVPRSDPDDPQPYHAYVSELAVNPELRGQGWGSRLLAWAEEQARLFGCPEMRIGVVASNAGALGLYQRLGFSADHVILGKSLS